MNRPAVSVVNLSKVYRLGTREERQDTFVSAFVGLLQSPVRNLKKLRRLSRFESGEEDDVIWALKDVSFDLEEGGVLGIIGRNGAGKSTLLKVLTRITGPSSGRAEVRGRVASLLEVGTGFHPDLTGRENVYLNGTILGMKKKEIDLRFSEIVEFAGVERFIDTPVKRYSSGMRVRLGFAVAANLEPDILVIDEVLAVGDAEFQRKCLGKMSDVAKQGRTVLFVSHNMEAVETLCARGIVLDKGMIAFEGNASDAVRFYHNTVWGISSDSHTFHVETSGRGRGQDCITKIEILNADLQPKSAIHTWDEVVFRVHYTSSHDVRDGTIVLDIFDQRSQRVIVLDSGVRIPLRQGDHIVDCQVPQFPLSAGDYHIGGGLGLSRSGWIWRNRNIGLIRVAARDVFSLGRPPVQERMLIAVPHQWRDHIE